MADDQWPNPARVAEAQSFAKQIEEMIDKPEADRKMLRFTITVPEEFATLAAWMILMEDMRKSNGGVPVSPPRPIMLRREDGLRMGDWQRAKDYFERAIFYRFDSDYVALQLGTHPVLLLDLDKPEPSSAPDSDDDFPF